MNRIFKVIWSKTRGCYIAVSELAKNVSTGGGTRNRVESRTLRNTLAAMAAVGMLWGVGAGVVSAAPTTAEGLVITATEDQHPVNLTASETGLTIDKPVTVTGSVTVNDGDLIVNTQHAIKGAILASTIGNGITYDASTFKVDGSGNVTAHKLTIGNTESGFDASGNLKAVAGTFTGAVSGTSGTFSDAVTGKSFAVGNTGNGFDESGNLKAMKGTFSDEVITSKAVKATGGFVVGETAFGIASTGAVSGTTGTFTGAVQGESFKVGSTGYGIGAGGAVSGTTGTFTGAITGASLDVGTGTIKGGSLTTTGEIKGVGVDASTGNVKGVQGAFSDVVNAKRFAVGNTHKGFDDLGNLTAGTGTFTGAVSGTKGMFSDAVTGTSFMLTSESGYGISSAGVIKGASLDVGNGAITGGAITGASLNVGNGSISNGTDSVTVAQLKTAVNSSANVGKITYSNEGSANLTKIDSNVNVTGALTAGSNLAVTGTSTFTGAATFGAATFSSGVTFNEAVTVNADKMLTAPKIKATALYYDAGEGLGEQTITVKTLADGNKKLEGIAYSGGTTTVGGVGFNNGAVSNVTSLNGTNIDEFGAKYAQIDTNKTSIANNAANIATLQTNTTGISYANSITTIANKTKITKDLAVGEKFTVAAETGNTAVDGTLAVTKAATFSDNVTVASGKTLTAETVAMKNIVYNDGGQDRTKSVKDLMDDVALGSAASGTVAGIARTGGTQQTPYSTTIEGVLTVTGGADGTQKALFKAGDSATPVEFNRRGIHVGNSSAWVVEDGFRAGSSGNYSYMTNEGLIVGTDGSFNDTITNNGTIKAKLASADGKFVTAGSITTGSTLTLGAEVDATAGASGGVTLTGTGSGDDATLTSSAKVVSAKGFKVDADNEWVTGGLKTAKGTFGGKVVIDATGIVTDNTDIDAGTGSVSAQTFIGTTFKGTTLSNASGDHTVNIADLVTDHGNVAGIVRTTTRSAEEPPQNVTTIENTVQVDGTNYITNFGKFGGATAAKATIEGATGDIKTKGNVRIGSIESDGVLLKYSSNTLVIDKQLVDEKGFKVDANNLLDDTGVKAEAGTIGGLKIANGTIANATDSTTSIGAVGISGVTFKNKDVTDLASIDGVAVAPVDGATNGLKFGGTATVGATANPFASAGFSVDAEGNTTVKSLNVNSNASITDAGEATVQTLTVKDAAKVKSLNVNDKASISDAGELTAVKGTFGDKVIISDTGIVTSGQNINAGEGTVTATTLEGTTLKVKGVEKSASVADLIAAKDNVAGIIRTVDPNRATTIEGILSVDATNKKVSILNGATEEISINSTNGNIATAGTFRLGSATTGGALFSYESAGSVSLDKQLVDAQGFKVDADNLLTSAGLTASKVAVDNIIIDGSNIDNKLNSGDISVEGVTLKDGNITGKKVTLKNASNVDVIILDPATETATIGSVAGDQTKIVKGAITAKNITATGITTLGKFKFDGAVLTHADGDSKALTIQGMTLAPNTISGINALDGVSVVAQGRDGADGLKFGGTATVGGSTNPFKSTGFTVDADGDTNVKSLKIGTTNYGFSDSGVMKALRGSQIGNVKFSTDNQINSAVTGGALVVEGVTMKDGNITTAATKTVTAGSFKGKTLVDYENTSSKVAIKDLIADHARVAGITHDATNSTSTIDKTLKVDEVNHAVIVGQFGEEATGASARIIGATGNIGTKGSLTLGASDVNGAEGSFTGGATFTYTEGEEGQPGTVTLNKQLIDSSGFKVNDTNVWDANGLTASKATIDDVVIEGKTINNKGTDELVVEGVTLKNGDITTKGGVTLQTDGGVTAISLNPTTETVTIGSADADKTTITKGAITAKSVTLSGDLSVAGKTTLGNFKFDGSTLTHKDSVDNPLTIQGMTFGNKTISGVTELDGVTIAKDSTGLRFNGTATIGDATNPFQSSGFTVDADGDTTAKSLAISDTGFGFSATGVLKAETGSRVADATFNGNKIDNATDGNPLVVEGVTLNNGALTTTKDITTDGAIKGKDITASGKVKGATAELGNFAIAANRMTSNAETGDLVIEGVTFKDGEVSGVTKLDTVAIEANDGGLKFNNKATVGGNTNVFSSTGFSVDTTGATSVKSLTLGSNKASIAEDGTATFQDTTVNSLTIGTTDFGFNNAGVLTAKTGSKVADLVFTGNMIDNATAGTPVVVEAVKMNDGVITTESGRNKTTIDRGTATLTDGTNTTTITSGGATYDKGESGKKTTIDGGTITTDTLKVNSLVLGNGATSTIGINADGSASLAGGKFTISKDGNLDSKGYIKLNDGTNDTIIMNPSEQSITVGNNAADQTQITKGAVTTKSLTATGDVILGDFKISENAMTSKTNTALTIEGVTMRDGVLTAASNSQIGKVKVVDNKLDNADNDAPVVVEGVAMQDGAITTTGDIKGKDITASGKVTGATADLGEFVIATNTMNHKGDDALTIEEVSLKDGAVSGVTKLDNVAISGTESGGLVVGTGTGEATIGKPDTPFSSNGFGVGKDGDTYVKSLKIGSATGMYGLDANGVLTAASNSQIGKVKVVDNKLDNANNNGPVVVEGVTMEDGAITTAGNIKGADITATGKVTGATAGLGDFVISENVMTSKTNKALVIEGVSLEDSEVSGVTKLDNVAIAENNGGLKFNNKATVGGNAYAFQSEGFTVNGTGDTTVRTLNIGETGFGFNNAGVLKAQTGSQIANAVFAGNAIDNVLSDAGLTVEGVELKDGVIKTVNASGQSTAINQGSATFSDNGKTTNVTAGGATFNKGENDVTTIDGGTVTTETLKVNRLILGDDAQAGHEAIDISEDGSVALANGKFKVDAEGNIFVKPSADGNAQSLHFDNAGETLTIGSKTNNQTIIEKGKLQATATDGTNSNVRNSTATENTVTLSATGKSTTVTDTAGTSSVFVTAPDVTGSRVIDGTDGTITDAMQAGTVSGTQMMDVRAKVLQSSMMDGVKGVSEVQNAATPSNTLTVQQDASHSNVTVDVADASTKTITDGNKTATAVQDLTKLQGKLVTNDGTREVSETKTLDSINTTLQNANGTPAFVITDTVLNDAANGNKPSTKTVLSKGESASAETNTLLNTTTQSGVTLAIASDANNLASHILDRAEHSDVLTLSQSAAEKLVATNDLTQSLTTLQNSVGKAILGTTLTADVQNDVRKLSNLDGDKVVEDTIDLKQGVASTSIKDGANQTSSVMTKDTLTNAVTDGTKTASSTMTLQGVTNSVSDSTKTTTVTQTTDAYKVAGADTTIKVPTVTTEVANIDAIAATKTVQVGMDLNMQTGEANFYTQGNGYAKLNGGQAQFVSQNGLSYVDINDGVLTVKKQTKSEAAKGGGTYSDEKQTTIDGGVIKTDTLYADNLIFGEQVTSPDTSGSSTSPVDTSTYIKKDGAAQLAKGKFKVSTEGYITNIFPKDTEDGRDQYQTTFTTNVDGTNLKYEDAVAPSLARIHVGKEDGGENRIFSGLTSLDPAQSDVMNTTITTLNQTVHTIGAATGSYTTTEAATKVTRDMAEGTKSNTVTERVDSVSRMMKDGANSLTATQSVGNGVVSDITSITDSKGKASSSLKGNEAATSVADKSGNIGTTTLTGSQAKTELKKGANSTSITTTIDAGTVFENSKQNTAFVEGGATNTTIKGNTITTGQITTDKLIIRGGSSNGGADGIGNQTSGELVLAGDGTFSSKAANADKTLSSELSNTYNGVVAEASDSTYIGKSDVTAKQVTNGVMSKEGDAVNVSTIHSVGDDNKATLTETVKDEAGTNLVTKTSTMETASITTPDASNVTTKTATSEESTLTKGQAKNTLVRDMTQFNMGVTDGAGKAVSFNNSLTDGSVLTAKDGANVNTFANSATQQAMTITDGTNRNAIVHTAKASTQTITDGTKTATVTTDTTGITVQSNGNTAQLSGDDVVINKGTTNEIKLSDIGDVKKIADELKGSGAANLVDMVNTEHDQRVAADNQLNQRITKLNQQVDRVGALAAAMSTLEPLPYDKEAPTSVNAAVGTYKGSTAVAIGVNHYNSQDTMLTFKVGKSGSDTMVGFGASFRVGRKNPAQIIEDERAKAEKQVAAAQERALAAHRLYEQTIKALEDAKKVAEESKNIQISEAAKAEADAQARLQEVTEKQNKDLAPTYKVK